MNPSITTDARVTTRTGAESAPDEGATPSRRANYVADVVFIALLAAPFLVFQAPASIRDAVLSAGAERPAIVTPVQQAAASPAAPVPEGYGPE
jgi:hypothetical protein